MVVSGVRSSWDRLSMNSVRMRWSRRSSVTSSTQHPDMPRPGAIRPRPDDQPTALRAVELQPAGLPGAAPMIAASAR